MKISAQYFWYYLRKFYEKEKIILYGEKKLTLHLKQITKTAGFEVAYVIGNEADEEVKSYVDLLYENFDKIFVWIISYEHLEYCDRLREIGLREHDHFAAISRPPYMNLGERFLLDVHLGYTSNAQSQYPGVTIYGNPDGHGENVLKIVTLGGSTSDAIAYPWKSWSELLWEKLSNLYSDREIIVYSAGVCAYTSSQELLKLQRDMLRINPDIVLSYSGLNDSVLTNDLWTTSYQQMIFDRVSLSEKFTIAGGTSGQGYSVGVESGESPVECYLNNMRMMNAVCQEFGIKFYAFLQAMMGEESYILKDDEAEIIRNSMDSVYEKTKIFLKEAKYQIKKYKYIYDCSEIFNIPEKLYVDTEHVNEDGNNIIADEIIRRVEWMA